jgi:hypothetical protein
MIFEPVVDRRVASRAVFRCPSCDGGTGSGKSHADRGGCHVVTGRLGDGGGGIHAGVRYM